MTETGSSERTTRMPGCDLFEGSLPDYLEGTLPEAERLAAAAHVRACASCAALLRGLESVRDEAASLPVLLPAADLWAGIERRIAAPVVALPPAHDGWADDAMPFHVHDARKPNGRGSATWRRPWLAAAAALLLVAGTAGVTYTLATAGDGGAGLAAGAAPRSGATLPAVVAVAPGASPAAGTALPAAPQGRGPGAAPAPAGGATLASDRAPAAGTALDAAAVYDREIALMRELLDARGAVLDTSTVRVLETNLGIIDRAIQESRAALLRDPSSRLLNQQLTDALDDKLELMRTAVLISSGAD